MRTMTTKAQLFGTGTMVTTLLPFSFLALISHFFFFGSTWSIKKLKMKTMSQKLKQITAAA